MNDKQQRQETKPRRLVRRSVYAATAIAVLVALTGWTMAAVLSPPTAVNVVAPSSYTVNGAPDTSFGLPTMAFGTSPAGFTGACSGSSGDSWSGSGGWMGGIPALTSGGTCTAGDFALVVTIPAGSSVTAHTAAISVVVTWTTSTGTVETAQYGEMGLAVSSGSSGTGTSRRT